MRTKKELFKATSSIVAFLLEYWKPSVCFARLVENWTILVDMICILGNSGD